MMDRLKERGLGRREIGFLLVGVVLALGALAAFGNVVKVSTNHTERVEKRVTTTERIPGRTATSHDREMMREKTTTLRQQVVTLKRDLRATRAAVSREAARQVAVYCAAHNGCKGDAGAKGDTGATGANGTNGHDGAGYVPPPVHSLDSSLLDGVDNRVTDLERLTDGLTSRLGGIERLLSGLCRILTPGKCA